MLILFALIFLTGCSWFEPPASPTPPPPDKHAMIIAKVQTYQRLAMESQDGISSLTGCDSLLWGSLMHYSGVPVEIDSYRAENKWFRNPSHACYPDNSRSTISRDQLTGLYYFILRESRLDLIEGLISYAEDHSFIMGEGSIASTHFTVNMLALAGRITYYLGGQSKYRHYPLIYPPGTERYHAHLQLLGIILVHKIAGEIPSNFLDRIEEHYTRNPRNGLAALLHAIYSGIPLDDVQAILLDESLFPSDRLPTPSDRCGFYLWQYEADQLAHDGKSLHWGPCDINEQFGGIDFLFAATLYIEEVERANTLNSLGTR